MKRIIPILIFVAAVFSVSKIYEDRTKIPNMNNPSITVEKYLLIILG
jgi:hypothetical protein